MRNVEILPILSSCKCQGAVWDGVMHGGRWRETFLCGFGVCGGVRTAKKEKKRPSLSQINLLPLDFSFLVAVAISLPWCQAGNEGGGTGSSLIVLDELSAIHWEYWYLDLSDPQSAECGKWEVSMDLSMRKMSEKCSSWKTVPFFKVASLC